MKTKPQQGFFSTLLHLKNYVSADLATKALGFISIPVLTRLLQTGEYGIINLFNSYISIFIILFTLNTHSSVSRYYYEGKEDLKEFFGTTVLFSLAIFAVISLVFLLLRNSILSIMDLPSSVYYFFIPITLIEIMNVLFMQIHLPQKKSRAIALVNVLRAYSRFGLGVLIIILLQEQKYLGMIIAHAGVGLGFAVYFWIALKPYFKTAFRKEHLKYIAGYSFPLIPYALSGIILAQFDRIMINSFKGNSDAGLYSFAYNIGMLLSIFVGAVNSSFVPDYFEYMKQGRYKEHDRDVDRFMRLIVWVGVGLILFGKEIGMILARENYHQALHVIPLVVMGYLFFAVFSVYSRNIGYAKKTVYSSLILLISSTANVVLNALYIPRYGYIAAAYTTLVSYVLMAGLSWVVSRFILKTHSTPLGQVLLPLVMGAPFIAVFYWLEGMDISFWLRVGMKFLSLLVLGGVVFFKYRHALLQLLQRRKVSHSGLKQQDTQDRQ